LQSADLASAFLYHVDNLYCHLRLKLQAVLIPSDKHSMILFRLLALDARISIFSKFDGLFQCGEFFISTLHLPLPTSTAVIRNVRLFSLHFEPADHDAAKLNRADRRPDHLMMALAAFNLLVMPSDLMVKLAAYGISPDHRAVYVMTWGTVIATLYLAWVAYRSWRRR
jgi:hypothetical protein